LQAVGATLGASTAIIRGQDVKAHIKVYRFMSGKTSRASFVFVWAHQHSNKLALEAVHTADTMD
jgi:hypothetical protein